jgi:hypothetical protein
MACLNNNDKITWSVNVGSNSTISATGVAVTFNIPAGVNIIQTTASKGVYDDNTDTWSIGSIAPNASHSILIVAEVSDFTLQPFTLQASVAGNEFETYLLNNIAEATKGGGCSEGCAQGFTCTNNDYSCTCGQIQLDSGLCGTGSTIDFRIVEDSEVNATVDLDSLTGRYKITVLDRNIETWSFDYEIYCCCGEICTGPLVSCTISGNTDCCPETTSTMVDNGDGTYTYTDETGVETVIAVNLPAQNPCECEDVTLTTKAIELVVFAPSDDNVSVIATHPDGLPVNINFDGTVLYGIASGATTTNSFAPVFVDTVRTITVTDNTGQLVTQISIIHKSTGVFHLIDDTTLLRDEVISGFNVVFNTTDFVNPSCPTNGNGTISFTSLVSSNNEDLTGTVRIDLNSVMKGYKPNSFLMDGVEEITSIYGWTYGLSTVDFEAWLTSNSTGTDSDVYFKGLISLTCEPVV